METEIAIQTITRNSHSVLSAPLIRHPYSVKHDLPVYSGPLALGLGVIAEFYNTSTILNPRQLVKGRTRPFKGCNYPHRDVKIFLPKQNPAMVSIQVYHSHDYSWFIAGKQLNKLFSTQLLQSGHRTQVTVIFKTGFEIIGYVMNTKPKKGLYFPVNNLPEYYHLDYNMVGARCSISVPIAAIILG